MFAFYFRFTVLNQAGLFKIIKRKRIKEEILEGNFLLWRDFQVYV